MTIIEQIKAEIERRNLANYCGTAEQYEEELFAFLDTLESEKPVLNDLEEAAEKSSTQYYKDAGYSPFPNVETAAHKSGFIAGAKWQKEQDDKDFSEEVAAAYQIGLADKERQMMKEAVEGDYDCQYCAPAIFLDRNLKGIKDGDKVRVIVYKKED